jgi:endothelin-converting enzyme/putative endopeptidase
MKLLPYLTTAGALALALPLAAQTASSGVELNALDKSVSPCTNFYQYACGQWVKDHPVPPDQSRWNRFNDLAAKNEEIEHTILEQAAHPGGKTRTPVEQKIGDYYTACMNESAIESQGIAPLQPLLDSIANLKSRAQLTAEVIRLQQAGVRPFLSLRVEPDQKNASVYIVGISQGGISMPDRDYYLRDDAKSEAIRREFREHVRKMFEMLDQARASEANAAAQADVVLRIETELARNSLERVALRNPDNTYHLMTVQQLAELAPDFNWREYLAQPGMPQVKTLNVAQPDFFHGLNRILSSANFDDLKTYFVWHALNDIVNLGAGRTMLEAVVLPKRFSDENWNFNSHILNGVQQPQPRWKSCVQMTDRLLGEALGQQFVRVAFSASSKEKTLEMVREIESEMAKVIRSADWMSAATKDQAITKLHLVANKIGYPEKWRDYSKVTIVPNDAFGDTERAIRFAVDRQFARIGKPVDKSEWSMTPPTVNAYYSPEQNNINFPAGILQPPFYNPKAGDPVNYGGIGAVIGHELTHGFDDQGRRYDGRGNLREWWTPEDGKAFEQRADCVVKEYGGFSPVPGVTLNGKLTLGENAADNGGLRLSLMALMDRMAGRPLSEVDGLTPQQQFFLGYAQLWCGDSTPESAAVRAKTDPHSPGEFRVNGVLQNMPEFSSAWGCKVGDAMVSDKACRIW